MSLWHHLGANVHHLWRRVSRWAADVYQVIAVAGGAAAVGIGLSLVLPRHYTVGMSVMPETLRGTSELATLAQALGPFAGAVRGLGAGEISLTPDFIAQVATSDTVLLIVARGTAAQDGKAVYELFGRRGRSHADSLMRAVEYLRRRVIAAAPDRRTPIVNIAVQTGDSLVSTGIAQSLLAALNQVLVVNRQTAVSNERHFLEIRSEAARDDLTGAEARMRDFLERNKNYDQSPNLQFEYARLQRQIVLAQELYLAVARELQVAGADEVRNTPVLNILESPRPPTRPDRRRPALYALALAGIVVGVSLAIRLIDQMIVEPRFE